MKATFFLGAFTLLTLVVSSCTKIETEDQLPDISLLTPEQITSDLDRMNITVSQDSLEYMLSKPWSKIIISAEIDYYSPNGKVFDNKAASIEIKGTGSANNTMKSIGILFDEALDNSMGQFISEPASNGNNLNSLQSITLRNSGQDFGKTVVKDLAYSLFALRMGMNIEVKYGKPVHLFFNGSYYGLLNLRTEDSSLGIAQLFDVPEQSVTMAKMNIASGKLKYKVGNEALVHAVHEATETNDIGALKSLIDIDNYLDYLIYQDYIGNMDWPHNNVIMFSVNNEPFRFFFFDSDLAGQRPKNYRLPEMEYGEDDMSEMFQVLIKDEQFLSQLEERQRHWYKQFSPEKFDQIVDELTFQIQDDLPYLIAKWGEPNSMFEWQLSIAQLKRDFERTDHFNRKKYNQ